MLILGFKLGKSFAWCRERFWVFKTYIYPCINNRGLNSEKTFWVIVRGYYSREVTIQEKLFCTFSMSTTLFHRNFYKNFQKTLGCRLLLTFQFSKIDRLYLLQVNTYPKYLLTYLPTILFLSFSNHVET